MTIYEIRPWEVVMAGDEQVFYASLIGDMWSLVLTGGDRYHRLVKHQPNASSGGIVAHNIEKLSSCALRGATRRTEPADRDDGW
jgi:hypothetical protein